MALSAPALAAQGPALQPSATATSPALSAAHPKNVGRPIFLGLIAAVFLVLGATVGANDNPDGEPQHKR